MLGVTVLDMIGKNASCSEDRIKAQAILYSFESFDFIFMVHLMLTIFGYTNDLCVALQKRDQNIVNDASLVSLSKQLLQKTRDCGWETLLDKVTSFCTKYGIVVPDMEASYMPLGRSRRFVQQETNLQHFRIQIFVGVIDLQLMELNERFDEVNTEFLKCMACLSPRDGFSSYDKEKILKLATFYPSEFSGVELMSLEYQLDIYIEDLRKDDRFGDLNDLGALSMMLVETKKHETYPTIYLLIKLVLILPVATAGVERVFSGMTYVKNRLRNSMGDQLLNDCLVTFIEKNMFLQIPDDDVIDRFQKMKTRRVGLNAQL
ncbi:uncharacterized protein LOC131018221 [Salvia miltiorrhiza]|uniref:uncharacterized protein LOC131018221 n=1 Tax=Salvia miltiorrhiza TaxID=226208 RepID=UPI0025AD0C49|nr:uncharacterized protein LOC131018221 [Salvia miltiorrhiza]